MSRGACHALLRSARSSMALLWAACITCMALIHAAPLRAQAPAQPPPPAGAAAEAADVAPEEPKPSSGWAALPIGTYTPETSLGLGAFGSHFFRLGGASAQTRPSSISVVGLYTLREQLITELIPEMYWDDERWHIWSRLDYRRYPNRLWAVGNRALRSSEEGYSEDRVRLQGLVDHALVGDLRVEGKVEVISMKLSHQEPGGLLDTRAIPGAEGGRTVGFGMGVLWDSRDHLLTPHRGDLHEIAVMSFGEAIGSEHGFSTVVLDFRKYLPVTATHTLALQLYTELQSGSVPFYKLAQLGGEDLLRGLYQGRFRDKALCAAQVEYRLPLFWRFSGVLHAALGQVAHEANALLFRAPEWSTGAGARVLLNRDEGLNLRADFGVGREGFGIYIGISEAY